MASIEERTVPWSYLKVPYWKPRGYEAGQYRVGPLARLNVASQMKTPLAQKEFLSFKELGKGKPVEGSFFFHYARLIEVLAYVEEIEALVKEPEITSNDICAYALRNQSVGVGCSEAPRGILFHRYQTDRTGVLTKVDLLIATGQNNLAMNRSVLQVAKQYVNGNSLSEEGLNRVEGAIRCYDPCLSCSTHALGSMPLAVEFYSADGRLIGTAKRG